MARERAREALSRFERGAPAPAPVPHPRSALTLGALLDRYESTRLREGPRTKSLPQAMRMLRGGLFAYLNLPAASFTKADVRAARDALTERGLTRQPAKLVAALGTALQWAAHEDLIEHNVALAVRKPPAVKRSRVLTQGELAAIWHACAALGGYGRLVRFLALTGQQRGEAAGLRHGDILDRTWRQSADSNKAQRAHAVPLSSFALELVGQGEPQEHVFREARGGPIHAFGRRKRALDMASGVTGWRLHDLRRTAASGMQDVGIRPDVIGAVLNHTVPGVGGIYMRSELEVAKRDALSRWATEVERIRGAGERAAA